MLCNAKRLIIIVISVTISTLAWLLPSVHLCSHPPLVPNGDSGEHWNNEPIAQEFDESWGVAAGSVTNDICLIFLVTLVFPNLTCGNISPLAN